MFQEGVLQGYELILTSSNTLDGIRGQKLLKFNTLRFWKKSHLCIDIVHTAIKSFHYSNNICTPKPLIPSVSFIRIQYTCSLLTRVQAVMGEYF